MGAEEPVVERERGGGGDKKDEEEEEVMEPSTGGGGGAGEEERVEQVVRDVEKGEMGYQEEVVGSMRNVDNPTQTQTQTQTQTDYHASMMQSLNPTNPLRIVINGRTRVATPSPAPPGRTRVATPSPAPSGRTRGPTPSPAPSQPSVARSTPTPQQSSIVSLNSRGYTNKFSLFLFLLHMVAAIGLVCFLLFKG
ncbi:hypothetical protein CRG98_016599, partial [Punica granatum]